MSVPGDGVGGPPVHAEFSLYLYRALWKIAWDLRRAANDQPLHIGEAGFGSLVGCMLFSFLTLEAYANQMLPIVDMRWWKKNEENAVLAKVSRVAEVAGLDWEQDRSPAATIIALKHLRDRLAHGRVEHFSDAVAGEGGAGIISFHKMKSRATRYATSLPDIVNPVYADMVLSDIGGFIRAAHGPLVKKMIDPETGVIRTEDLLMNLGPDPFPTVIMFGRLIDTSVSAVKA